MTERAEKLQQTLKMLKAVDERKTFNKAAYFEAYPKQQAFFDMGAFKSERLLMAGNQLGKTEAGAYETMCHLTGLYPTWWMGRKWDRPTRGWICGETGTVVRDVQQKKLCGEPGVISAFGTGMIPKHLFVDKPSLARGVTDAYDTIQVRHISGGVSVARFKSYEQGRAKFQAETLDWIWFDEEPPMDIYSEGITRYTATGGMAYMTFTPLQGRSKVVERFLSEKSADRGVVMMGIADALHISPEARAAIIAKYPLHERKARSNGEPMLGSGAIFPYDEAMIAEPAIQEIPPHWFKLWGIDIGIDHPFAAALILWDKDADVIHVHYTVRMQGEGETITPLQHAAAMKPIGAGVPVAWPQDAHQRDKGSGIAIAHTYRKHGLNMLASHACWPDGGNGTEAGILEMQERITTGRFKVASHLSDFFEEYRLYHRKDGVIVRVKDDLLSAIRVAIMAKRYARQVPLGGTSKSRRKQAIADGVDFDPLE